jgi:methyltransferase of FxLD system
MRTEERLRRKLVGTLRETGWLRDGAVAAAFAEVPRHLFVPGYKLKDVYGDNAIVTKVVDGVGMSSSSQPSIMAIMLQQLQLERGQRVLEIGAGTGYNAALLSHLVGPRGRVTTVDIDAETAREARAHLRAAGQARVRVLAADGGFGHAGGAPYHRIIATASCWQIPQPWVDQLTEGGLLVLPFRLNGAHVSLALRKEGDTLVSAGAALCGFMPLRGAFGPRNTYLDLPGMRVAADARLSARLERALPRVLAQERTVRVAFPRRRDGRNTPLYYLALQGLPVVVILRRTDSWGTVPFALVASPRSAIGLPWHRAVRGRLPLYGSDEARVFLERALARWHDAGQPDQRQLRVRVRPATATLGSLPRGANGRYRLRRGDHAYELWFERGAAS